MSQKADHGEQSILSYRNTREMDRGEETVLISRRGFKGLAVNGCLWMSTVAMVVAFKRC